MQPGPPLPGISRAEGPLPPGSGLRGEWRHRGCIVFWDLGDPHRQAPFAIHHISGLPLGRANSLTEARQLIDERILLVRQRLAAST